MAKIAVCGIGNRLRGDDAAGPLVIDMLAQSFPAENVLLLDCGTVPERFTSKIVSFSPDMLIIVDAVDMGRPPGTVEQIPVSSIKRHFTSTHKMPITMFIEYLQRSMPRIEIIFLGIQQKQTLFGTEPGTECERAVEQAATKVGMYLNG